ncbi:MAG: GlcNAc-PI de-N-acetylase [Acidimicrobiia bacterium]|nr:GlcNAc-PI de-N-acetylase [Acidimicrobiia bacterium]
MTQQLTLMAVHAHPDDESSSTGGVLARYSAEGMRTVLVTCTNGEFGDAPGGVKPGEDGHDPASVAALRLGELKAACDILGVTDQELLGYSDSGMPDWEYKERPDVFCNVPLDVGAARLAALFEKYRPDVVVTYDDYAPYNHPDHVHASEITMAAVKLTGIPKKAYFTAMRRRDWDKFRKVLEDLGVEVPQMPDRDDEWMARMDALETRITTTIDIAPFVKVKRRALTTHASQIQESFFGKLPDESFGMMFGLESFIRVVDSTGASVPEDDLFAGLR